MDKTWLVPVLFLCLFVGAAVAPQFITAEATNKTGDSSDIDRNGTSDIDYSLIVEYQDEDGNVIDFKQYSWLTETNELVDRMNISVSWDVTGTEIDWSTLTVVIDYELSMTPVIDFDLPSVVADQAQTTKTSASGQWERIVVFDTVLDPSELVQNLDYNWQAGDQVDVEVTVDITATATDNYGETHTAGLDQPLYTAGTLTFESATTDPGDPWLGLDATWTYDMETMNLVQYNNVSGGLDNVMTNPLALMGIFSLLIAVAGIILVFKG